MPFGLLSCQHACGWVADRNKSFPAWRVKNWHVKLFWWDVHSFSVQWYDFSPCNFEIQIIALLWPFDEKECEVEDIFHPPSFYLFFLPLHVGLDEKIFSAPYQESYSLPPSLSSLSSFHSIPLRDNLKDCSIESTSHFILVYFSTNPHSVARKLHDLFQNI